MCYFPPLQALLKNKIEEYHNNKLTRKIYSLSYYIDDHVVIKHIECSTKLDMS